MITVLHTIGEMLQMVAAFVVIGVTIGAVRSRLTIKPVISIGWSGSQTMSISGGSVNRSTNGGASAAWMTSSVYWPMSPNPP